MKPEAKVPRGNEEILHQPLVSTFTLFSLQMAKPLSKIILPQIGARVIPFRHRNSKQI